MGILGKFLLSIGSGLATLAIVGIVYVRTTLPDREDVFEMLDAPRIATGWTSKGIVLETGEIVPLDGLDALPPRSEILDEIVRRGIEVDPGGHRVYALLPIHHWCGNDPIDKHVVRIDVASLVRFLDPTRGPPKNKATWEGMRCDSVGEGGWDITCFQAYERWLEGPSASR